MSNTHIRICLAFLFSLLGLHTMPGKEAPTSAEQLRSALETALKAKDAKAVIALFNWECVPEESKEMVVEMGIMHLLKTNIASVALSPVSTNLQVMLSNEQNDWQGDNGRRVSFSVEVLGELAVNIPNANKVPLPYGKKGTFFYLAAPIPYLAHGKSLRVSVLRYPLSLTYTGSWVYVNGGREIKVEVSNRTNQFRQGWGDCIKSCIIRRTSPNTLPPRGDSFHFEISEGGTTVFKSPEMTNEDPVVYERKQPIQPPASAEQIQHEIESQLKASDAAWRKHRELQLPVKVSHRIGDDCILVIHSYTNADLSLTVKAVREGSPKTNSCSLNLGGGTSKELNLLAGWVLTPEDQVRVEIVSPRYDISRVWITGCRTPSHNVAGRQETFYKVFNQTKDQTEKETAAQTLSDLWRAGLLDNQIKEQLLRDHYQLVLRQIPSKDGVPSWIVYSSLTFPFPDVYTDFTPTLYSNDQIKWSPGKPQTSCAMTATNNPITSMTGGVFKNGDVLQCRIDLGQTIRGQSWQTSVWTSKLVLQGLKD
jgi:hypothetical protein